MRRSTRRLAAALAAPLLLTACAAQPEVAPAPERAASSAEHTMADGTTMSDAEMQAMGSDDETSPQGEAEGEDEGETTPAPGEVTHWQDGPSSAAAMICSMEIAEAVQSALALPTTPAATDDWRDQTYTCTYALPTGTMRLSVKDLDDEATGRAWFDSLSDRLEGARPVPGLQNLGFPAVRTPGPVGSVAFLKDHKTLWVDAGDVDPGSLRAGFSRSATAYNVASHVISCWTE